MRKDNNIILQDARNKPLAYIVQVVGLIVIILNLYLATKLQPIAKNVEVNAGHIQQLQNDIVGKELFVAEINNIQSRLTRIESKLDKALGQ